MSEHTVSPPARPAPYTTSTLPPRRRLSATTVTAVVAFFAFAVVLVSVEFLTARGQLEFGKHYMNLHGPGLAAAYLGLQGGVLATAALGLWATLARDRATSHTLWTLVFMAAAATAAYLGAHAAGWPTTGAVYAAGFSVAALRTWHAILKRIRRDLSPSYGWFRFPLTMWTLAPRTTWKAFRLSHVREMAPADALALVNGEQRITPPSAPVSPAAAVAVNLTAMSKADAARAVAAELGTYDTAPVRAELARRGVDMDKSQCSAVLRGERDARARDLRDVLHVVGGNA